MTLGALCQAAGPVLFCVCIVDAILRLTWKCTICRICHKGIVSSPQNEFFCAVPRSIHERRTCRTGRTGISFCLWYELICD